MSGAEDILAAVRRLGLLGANESAPLEPLTGGVSSDIWRVDLPGGAICVKRALPKLKVAADWRAPVSRNGTEVAWIETAAAIVPDSVPRIRGHDPSIGAFAMDFLPPDRFPLWKTMLRDGQARVADAAAVGDRLGRIHAGTARKADLADRFATDEMFHLLRLGAYLEATAQVHADLAPQINELVRRTASTKLVLVHGDISPKNILIGPDAPMFLDAEAAWYGDPAFDLAFCLNHLLLKCLWNPAATNAFMACFGALQNAYLAHVRWEEAAALEARTATLLPGLFLARVDGKSPVEYVTTERDKSLIRRVARHLIAHPVERLEQVRTQWREALDER
jgi:aminoglycoside phosphotransferase (APT) family kinase protein